MTFASPTETATWLTHMAETFMKGPENDIHLPGTNEPAFDIPLVAFAAGDDPIWNDYKEHVGAYHWTPLEAFSLAYPDQKAAAADLVVMSWVLPQTDLTRRDNRKQKDRPAERWARSRIFGEELVNEGLRKYMVTALREKGIPAVAPQLMSEWREVACEKRVFASSWSERHAAHAAGLGTFGLCDGLITPVGKAMRTGSVVMRLAVPVSARSYTHHREYCLFYNSGTCGVCIRRCPAGALSTKGHDKIKCREYIRGVTAPFVETTWHFKGYGCGFCQVGVPCEKSIPSRPKARTTGTG